MRRTGLVNQTVVPSRSYAATGAASSAGPIISTGMSRNSGCAANHGQHLEAIGLGHLRVDDKRVELSAERVLHHLDGPRAGGGFGDLASQLVSCWRRIRRCEALSSTSRIRKPLSTVGCSGRARAFGSLARVTEKRNVEPLPGSLVTPIGAAHQLHQLFADGQSQSGAAVLARGRGILLDEGLEDGRAVLGPDADAGVDDLEA